MPSPATHTEKPTPDLATYLRRWLLLNRGGLRAALIGAISLALFLLAWHLLTTNSGAGDPGPSTAAKGEALTEVVVDRLAAFLVDLAASPLDDRFPF